MPDPTQRHPENVHGQFYVDSEECIACTRCFEEASEFFRESEEDGSAFVHTQPKTADEIARAEEALDECPVEAIGQGESSIS